MRSQLGLGLTVAFLACSGSSPDVCQQQVALLQAQFSKDNSCVPDAGPDAGDAGPVDLDGGLKSCEVAIRSCDGGDLALLESEVECQQALASSYKCQWLTEANPQADQTFYSYTQGLIACGNKLAKVSNPICGNAL
jgi:hypothetical protein